MTDNLVDTMSRIGYVDDADCAEILSMGERASARIFCAALIAKGVKAEFIDPASDKWPVITDSNFCNAKPNYQETKIIAQKMLVPMLQTTVLVICGFLGRDISGKITTLGRGGSDITALLLGNCLEAGEVVLVKETSGVLSADPRIVAETRFLEVLDIHELFDLVQGGAKIVKPEALKYKLPNQRLRIVSYESESLAEGGTEVKGFLNSDSVEVESRKDLLAINVVGEVTANILKEVFTVLNSRPIYGISSGKNSVTIFTSDGNIGDVTSQLNEKKGFKAISHRENVAVVQVNHPSFVDSPGGVARISTALSREAINIIEVTTSKATINVFIEESQLKRAMKAIGDAFES
jgi:aspartate kinase